MKQTLKYAIALGILIAVIVTGLLFSFRYAPLGNVSGVGAGVYVYDRITGDLFYITGNNKYKVKGE